MIEVNCVKFMYFNRRAKFFLGNLVLTKLAYFRNLINQVAVSEKELTDTLHFMFILKT